MAELVITISREYGSGGHDIGKRLAGLLHIPFYDSEIVSLTAKRHDVDADSLSDMENMSKRPLPFGLTSRQESDEHLFLLQSQTIIELARESCVIVGRCADFILQNHPGRYSFFVYSGIKKKLERMEKQPGVYQTADAAKETEKMDRRRAAYYKYYTGQEWGKPSNYHLCVDSSVLGPNTAEALAAFIHLGEQMK